MIQSLRALPAEAGPVALKSTVLFGEDAINFGSLTRSITAHGVVEGRAELRARSACDLVHSTQSSDTTKSCMRGSRASSGSFSSFSSTARPT